MVKTRKSFRKTKRNQKQSRKQSIRHRRHVGGFFHYFMKKDTENSIQNEQDICNKKCNTTAEAKRQKLLIETKPPLPEHTPQQQSSETTSQQPSTENPVNPVKNGGGKKRRRKSVVKRVK